MNKQEIKQKLNEIETRNNPSIYTRIVGYYRPLENFNISKKSEFIDREVYSSNAK